MAQVIVKGIDTSVIERLKARAKQHKTTLQAEVKEILEQASRQDMVTARKVAAQLRRKLGARLHSDSTTLLAENRHR